MFLHDPRDRQCFAPDSVNLCGRLAADEVGSIILSLLTYGEFWFDNDFFMPTTFHWYPWIILRGWG